MQYGQVFPYLHMNIAFSNHPVGGNQLGVGPGGDVAWNNVSKHDHEQFTKQILFVNLVDEAGAYHRPITIVIAK